MTLPSACPYSSTMAANSCKYTTSEVLIHRTYSTCELPRLLCNVVDVFAFAPVHRMHGDTAIPDIANQVTAQERLHVRTHERCCD
jgi:hypothetical protein